MPGYVAAAIHKFNHPLPKHSKDAPRTWNQPTYGAAIQYALKHDTAATLPAPQITRIQQIIGTLLYYSLAVNPTMLVALGPIAAKQTKATENTANAVVKLLNYAATHPNATIRYHASDMILYAHSDALYLSAPQARSRVGCHFFLSQQTTDCSKAPAQQPRLNSPIHMTCHILCNVMASAAEAKVGALFLNSQDALPLRVTLKELGHPQPPTPMQTDNCTAAGFANDTIKQKRSKAIDMRFYWIKDQVHQKQCLIYWRLALKTLATIIQNIIRPVTTDACFPHPYSKQLFNKPIFCEGVLNPIRDPIRDSQDTRDSSTTEHWQSPITAKQRTAAQQTEQC
jgi:hypothetical protein